MAKAYDVSLFLMNNGSKIFTNSLDGNLKLQKMLFFADMIHLAEHNKPLFSDMPITAFKKGCVVEPIRLKYKNHYDEFKREAKNSVLDIENDERTSLELTLDIFGEISANELTELCHQFECWEACYEASLVDGQPMKRLAEIPAQALKEERFKIKPVLEAYRFNSQLKMKNLTVKGKTFFYNPLEINIDNNIISFLESIDDDEDCYTLAIDEGRIVVY